LLHGVDSSIGSRSGRSDGDHCVVEDDGSVGHDAERSVADVRVVGDEQSDVVDDGRRLRRSHG